MIYNVIPGTFNKYGIRNGDMIAMINFLQWYRKDQGNDNIKFHIRQGVIVNQSYCHEFFNFLKEHTDFFTDEEGYGEMPYNEVMLWDFRDIIGDHVVINNNREKKQKIVVFPVYDAEYHTYRNWSIKLLDSILQKYSEAYPDHEKVLCVKDMPPIDANLHGFSVSTNFMNNIKHIMEAEIFIGGDTGTSHFASALDNGPECVYYYNGRGMLHTLPFYLLQDGKGTLNKFWVNCEGTTYNGELII